MLAGIELQRRLKWFQVVDKGTELAHTAPDCGEHYKVKSVYLGIRLIIKWEG